MIPNSSITLIRNCPLDNTYEHTLYFADENKQYEYFNNNNAYKLNNLQYTRVNKNTIKVALNIARVYTCNYMMFANHNYENKLFYAFITSVEYVNENTTQITFQLDVMQTWLFDYQLKQCFVEREHIANDTIGNNTVPEGLELGEYVVTQSQQFGDGELSLYIYVTGLPNSLIQKYPQWELFFKRGKVNGIPNPCILMRFNLDTITQEELDDIALSFNSDNEGNEIVSMFTLPKTFSLDGDEATTVTYKGLSGKISKRSDGTTVKNNKLYIAPYYTITANANGQSSEYRPELFNGVPTFKTYSYISPSMSVFLFPLNYQGVNENYNHGVTLKGFPQLAWKNDGYQTYMGEHANSVEALKFNSYMGLVSGVTAGVLSMATGTLGGIGNGIKSITSGISGVVESLAKIEDTKALPDTVKGVLASQDTLAVAGKGCFFVYYNSLRPEYITMIDDYFTRYGYATKKIKVPNRNVRKRWTYVKTVGCLLTGNFPYNYKKEICDIYDSGITFWKNASDIGNYSLDNPTL